MSEANVQLGRWATARQQVMDVLSARKHFAGGGAVADPQLNKLGLHPLRMLLSDGALRARRAMLQLSGVGRGHRDDLSGFYRDGLAVIHPIFPQGVFEALHREVRAYADDAEKAVPQPKNTRRAGFGHKRPFSGGFDRFDGSTLNRFLEIDSERTPLAAAAIRDSRLAGICAAASGFLHAPERFSVYQTVQGTHRVADLQQDAHRDTFHSTVKLWIFLEPVELQSGPFAYCPGSHRLTPDRLRWEYRRANQACAADAKRRGGAFRVSASELNELALEPPRPYPVPANTLVIADVRGVHCRSLGREGSERLALYASLRKWPFAPVPI